MRNDFHLSYFEPTLPNWPNGGWSVYQINGDEIADRIVRARVHKPKGGFPPYYTGPVIARHPWCGYLGTVETLADAMALINKAQQG